MVFIELIPSTSLQDDRHGERRQIISSISAKRFRHNQRHRWMALVNYAQARIYRTDGKFAAFHIISLTDTHYFLDDYAVF